MENTTQRSIGSWLPTCPGQKCCEHLMINDSMDYRGMEIPKNVAYVTVFSSLMSCIASVIIVYIYVRWKDIRTGSRSVITFLAIADFFTAFGYIMGSINYLIYFDNEFKPDCSPFEQVCAIQSFITTWSSMSSFFWTVSLGFYLYLTLVHTKIFLANRFIPLFHVVNWGFPILICVPLLATQKLGYSPFAASTWCYIRETNDRKPLKIWLILVAGKLWEITAYFIVIVLYTVIKCHIRRQTRIGEEKNYLSAGLVNAVRKADSKLVFIPMVFVLLRIWGTVQFFYTVFTHPRLITESPHRCYCVSPQYHKGLVFLGVMQAIGDGGQGWGNFILYVLASGKIRNRLFGWLGDCLHNRLPGHTNEEYTPINRVAGRAQSPPAPEVRQLTPRSSTINDAAPPEKKQTYKSVDLEPTTT